MIRMVKKSKQMNIEHTHHTQHRTKQNNNEKNKMTNIFPSINYIILSQHESYETRTHIKQASLEKATFYNLLLIF